MKYAHYCSNCRSWVKEPWIREVDFYLNERHPEGETGCTYHEPPASAYGAGGGRAAGAGSASSRSGGRQTGAHGGAQTTWNRGGKSTGAAGNKKGGSSHGAGAYGGSQSGRPGAYGGAQTAGNRAGTPAKTAGSQNGGRGTGSYGAPQPGRPGTYGGSQPGRAGAYGTSQPGRPGANGSRTEKRPGNPVVRVLVVLLIVFALQAFFRVVRQIVEQPQFDVDLGTYETEMPEYHYEELTDEEARAGGIACNASSHFAIQGEQIEEAVKKGLAACGCGVAGREQYSANGRDNEGATWYDSYTILMIREQVADSQPYVEINCDTVTGELHSIEVDLEKREDVLVVLEAVVSAMAEEGVEAVPMDYEALLSEGITPLVEKTDSFGYTFGEMELYGADYGMVYSLSIWPVYQE